MLSIGIRYEPDFLPAFIQNLFARRPVMRRSFLLYLLIFVFFFACASLKAERKVVDNTFYSSYPKFRIKVSPEYKYLGEVKESANRKATNLTTDLRYDFDSYIFILADNNRAKKGIAVQIEKISSYYVGDFFGRVENKLEIRRM